MGVVVASGDTDPKTYYQIVDDDDDDEETSAVRHDPSGLVAPNCSHVWQATRTIPNTSLSSKKKN